MSDGMWDIVAGKWKQAKGEIQKQWGKLTEDDIDQIQGEREKLMGRLQERYGMTKEEANREIDRWAERMKF
jgi:uncharacterized protein YjbJ (UPF0337 family)